MSESAVRAEERRFFDALLAADGKELDQVLEDDFLLIDVLTGSQVEKSILVDVVSSGRLRFDRIELEESRVRLYGKTAIVTGRTEISGRFGEAPFATHSRYSHVFVERDGRWRLVSAQGTPITAE